MNSQSSRVGPGATTPGSTLSDLDWRAALRRMKGAYADRTIEGYTSDFALFASWCAENDEVAVPASPELVSRYLEDKITDLSAVTLERRLAAIIRVHRLLGLPNPAESETVRLAMRRIKRYRPIRSRQAKGINRELRASMLAACGSDLRGLRDRALVALGFEGLLRRSELSSLEVRDFTRTGDGAPAVVVRRSKADPFGEGRVVVLSAATGDIVEQWVNGAGLQTGPLFRPVYGAKPVRRNLAGYSISKILKKIARQAGFGAEIVNAISGHSLRVGGAQTLLSDGHDVLRLMRIGGWKTVNTVSRYIERTDLRVWH